MKNLLRAISVITVYMLATAATFGTMYLVIHYVGGSICADVNHFRVCRDQLDEGQMYTLLAVSAFLAVWITAWLFHPNDDDDEEEIPF